MTIIMGHANPTIEMKGDTLVITVKADGDLAVSNFSEEQKNGSVLKPSCKPILLSTQFHKPI